MHHHILSLQKYFHGPGHLAEQKVSPPEPKNYDRNLRNSCREDILRAITLIEDRLEELGEITRPWCVALTQLRNEIAAGFEEN